MRDHKGRPLASLGDAVKFVPVHVTQINRTQKIVSVSNRKPKDVYRAVDKGLFADAMRHVVDLMSMAEQAFRADDITERMVVCYRFASVVSDVRRELTSLPKCTERVCLESLLSKAESLANRAFERGIETIHSMKARHVA